MDQSERLREALLDLDRARKKEAEQRQIAETLLAGLHELVSATGSDLYRRLFAILQGPLECEESFVAVVQDSGEAKVVASSTEFFKDLQWQVGPMFERVLSGRPVAIYDTSKVPEWQEQSAEVLALARSAIHFRIETPEHKALFTCVHSKAAHFSQKHIALVKRFSILASQAFRVVRLEETIKTRERLAELERELARARKMEALGLLAGGVAHDLNNILAGVVTTPELLLTSDNLTNEQIEEIKAIRDSGLRAAAIVRDLLTVARGVVQKRQVLQLNDVVQDFLNSPEHEAFMQRYPHVEVQALLDDDVRPVLASSVHVQKTVMNLVTNAVEALSDVSDGMVLVKTCNLSIEKQSQSHGAIEAGDYSLIIVMDNGKGIAQDCLEHIFEPFYAKKAMGRSGTGLGLTIVWNTMREHQGYVDVASARGETSFSLYFPSSQADVRKSPRRKPTVIKGNGELVLVIDDDERLRKIARTTLGKLGYRVDEVDSGEAALSFVEQNNVDIILLDMLLGAGLSGRETYERLISIRPGLKTVIVSGYALDEDVEAIQALGSVPFLYKPYTLADLSIAIADELKKPTEVP